MKPPRFDSQLLPLTTEASIERRVGSLVGRASRRQIWFLFLDDDDHQLPLLIPVEDYSSRPRSDDVDRFALLLGEVRERADAAGVIIVLERYGDSGLSTSDVGWAKVLHEAAAASGLAMRGILLSHARGVRPIAPDDYLFSNDGSESAG